jgi:hypothetical protein
MAETTYEGTDAGLVLQDQDKVNFGKTLRQEVGRKGFAQGIITAIETHGGHLIKITEEESTQEVLDNQPVILLLTHNYSYEVLAAIGGLPESKSETKFRNVKLIAEAASEESWLDEHTIPVSRAVQPKERIDKAKATHLNFSSLMKAASLVSEGGMVVMCPEGTRSKEDHWQNGVAALIKATKHKLSKENTNGFIVMCDVRGIDLSSYIADKASKYIPSLTPYKNVTVRYSQPIPLSDIEVENKSAEDITSSIESRYSKFVQHA